jgi:hypothetical protein
MTQVNSVHLGYRLIFYISLIFFTNAVVEYPATNGKASARPPQDSTSAVSGSLVMS